MKKRTPYEQRELIDFLKAIGLAIVLLLLTMLIILMIYLHVTSPIQIIAGIITFIVIALIGICLLRV